MLWPTSRQELLIRSLRLLIVTVIVLYLLVGLTMWPFETFKFPSPVKSITPQQLIALVNAGQVNALKITGRSYTGRLKDGKSVETTLPDNSPALESDLESSCKHHFVDTMTVLPDSATDYQTHFSSSNSEDNATIAAAAILAIVIDLILKYRKVRVTSHLQRSVR